MVNYCPECGEPVAGVDAFCSECGAELDADPGVADEHGHQSDQGQQETGGRVGNEETSGGGKQGTSGWGDQATSGWDEQPTGDSSRAGRGQDGVAAGGPGIPREGAVATFRQGLGWVLGLPVLVGAFTLLGLLNTASTAVAPTAEAIESGQTTNSALSSVLSLLAFVVFLVVTGTAYVYAERRVTGADLTGSLDEFFDVVTSVARRFFALLGVALLYIVSTVIGLVFLVIPGVYIGARLSLALPAVVIDDQGVIESLSTSWEVAQGNLLKIVGLVSLLFVGLIGAAIGGVFVALPVTGAFEAANIPGAETAGSAAIDPILAVVLGAYHVALARVYLENRDDGDQPRDQRQDDRRHEQQQEQDPAAEW